MGKHRLLIVVAALFPLLWIASEIWYFGYFGGNSAGSFEAVAANGNVHVSWENIPQWLPGFYFGRVHREMFGFDDWDFAGFGRNPYPAAAGVRCSFVRVPLWFLSCVSMGLSGWLWWRKRQRREGRFPVVMTSIK